MEETGACSNTSFSSAIEPKDDIIKHRIQHIRKQLDDTYNLFINAKEALSNISFENLNEKMTSETPQSTTCQEVLVVGDDNKIDVAKSLANLESTPRCPENLNKYENIPELNKFFHVMADLKEGIRNISKHQESIAKLNEEIDDFEDNVKSNPIEDQLMNITLEDSQ